MISWFKKSLDLLFLKGEIIVWVDKGYLIDLFRSWYMLGKYLFEVVVVKLIVIR